MRNSFGYFVLKGSFFRNLFNVGTWKISIFAAWDRLNIFLRVFFSVSGILGPLQTGLCRMGLELANRKKTMVVLGTRSMYQYKTWVHELRVICNQNQKQRSLLQRYLFNSLPTFSWEGTQSRGILFKSCWMFEQMICSLWYWLYRWDGEPRQSG